MIEPPAISFVMAALDEEAYIEESVRSLLLQHYPPDRIEVAVADGGSTDRTRDIVSRLMAEDGRVRLLHNPHRIAASAFNLGIAATTGSIVSLVSAHSITDPMYASRLVESFVESGAALVGGRAVAAAAPDATSMARAIVRATTSPLGLGPARFRYSDRPGWVDTAFPGAYRRELFDEIGTFDESLVRNQDDEFHLRAQRAGHRMWFDPRLQSIYRPRRTLPRLWRQYYEYGWWRAATIAKHGRVASARHLVPAALVAGLAAGPVAVVVGRRSVGAVWMSGVLAWLSVLVAAGRRERECPRDVVVRVPAAVGCLHIAYGAGVWTGALQQTIRALRGRATRPPDERATAPEQSGHRSRGG